MSIAIFKEFEGKSVLGGLKVLAVSNSDEEESDKYLS